MNLHGLIRQVFLTDIGEAFIIARAGIRRTIMLGAANAHKQGGKKQDQDIGSSAMTGEVVNGIAFVKDGCHDGVFRLRCKYNPAFRNSNFEPGLF